MTPLQKALGKVESFELKSIEKPEKGTGLLKKEDVIKILEDFEVDCINYGPNQDLENERKSFKIQQ